MGTHLGKVSFSASCQSCTNRRLGSPFTLFSLCYFWAYSDLSQSLTISVPNPETQGCPRRWKTGRQAIAEGSGLKSPTPGIGNRPQLDLHLHLGFWRHSNCPSKRGPYMSLRVYLLLEIAPPIPLLPLSPFRSPRGL